MIDRIKEELDTAQDHLRNVSERITNQTDELLRTARHQAHLARGEGQEKLWNLETTALERAEDILGRASEVRAVAKVADSLERIVHQRLDSVTSSPIDAFDTLNARTAASAVRQLELVDLLKVERIESANKNRKTVMEAIERRRERLQKPPFRD